MATTTDFFKVAFGAEDELSGPMAGIAAGAAKLVAGFVALDALGDVFKGSIAGAIEAETSMLRLAGSIERAGGSMDVVGDKVNEFAADIQSRFGIADDAVTDSISRFIDYGATVDESMALFRQAMDLAAGKTIDLTSAVDALARAYSGSTGMLQRYLGASEEMLGQGEKIDVLRARLDSIFGGKAQEQVNSSATGLKRFSTAWSELLESAGKQVTGRGGVNVFVDPFTSLFQVLAEAIKPAETLQEKFEAQLEVVTYYNEQIDILNGLNQTSGPLWDEITKRLGIASHVLESLGNQMAEAAATTDQTGMAQKNLAAAFAATTGPATEASDAIDSYERNLETLNSTWAQTLKMMRGEDLFGGLGAGDGVTAAERAISDYEHFLDLVQGNAQLGADGGMSMIWEHEEEVARKALDNITDHRTEYEQFALASTGQLTSEIAGMFVGLEVDLKGVFKNIAKDYITLVLNEILKQTALRLGQQLFGLLFPAQGGLLAAAGAAAGASKIGAGGVTGASVQNHYYIDTVIGTDEYVSEHLGPALERRTQNGHGRLALITEGAL